MAGTNGADAGAAEKNEGGSEKSETIKSAGFIKRDIIKLKIPVNLSEFNNDRC